MTESIQRYLEKRADLERRPLVCETCDGVDQAVVIPVLAESGHLFETLASLAVNPITDLRRTLVICVVNNRAAPFADPAHIEDNRRTLVRLDGMVHGDRQGVATPCLLGYVDASSPGRELPEKSGVGLARKIGLDCGLAVLSRNGSAEGLLFSLDADTRTEPNYLPAVRRHFETRGCNQTRGCNPLSEKRKAWAAVVSYAHPLDGPPGEVAAIVHYEIFLRYHVLGLQYARSPYAFPTIGSTMVCRAEAYAAVSGMNDRQAGEDFYFLQQLAKTGGVDQIATTTVYPSSRPSMRVPFGTGPRVHAFMTGTERETTVYNPECYRIAKAWLEHVGAHLDATGEALLSFAETQCPALRRFLDAQDFGAVWPKLQRNSPALEQRLRQFHRWFDGFKTLKLIHFLRDNGFPQRDLFDAVFMLIEWIGDAAPVRDRDALRNDLEMQKELLYYLRALAKSSSEETRL